MRPRNPTEDEYKQMLANMGKVGVNLGGTGYKAGNVIRPLEAAIKPAKTNIQARELALHKRLGERAGSTPAPPPILPRELVIVGQIKSGKNRILITRTGHRYPPKEFKAWRDEVVEDMRKQWKQPAIIFPVSLWCQYWPGDRRTRDVSGMMDAMFHVLVKAGVLHDDGLVWNCSWFRMEMNKKGPKVLITVREWGL